MDDINEKLKLKAELEAFSGLYNNLSIEQHIPFSKENFKELTSKEQKICTKYVDEFVKNHENITFKEFVQEWVKKANNIWDDGNTLYYEGMAGIILKFKVHHYIAHVLFKELEKQLPTEKFNQLKELQEYYQKQGSSKFDGILMYKNVSEKHTKMYENITVGFSKENIEDSFEDYITYLCATLYLIHEYITEDLIKNIIELKSKNPFNIKLTKKEMTAMSKKIYEEITTSTDIKTFIIDKFVLLKETMRRQLGGLLLLFDFTDYIFESEKELVVRGRKLTKNLFYDYLLDEFINSDEEMKQYYEQRIVFAVEKNPITLLEIDKDWFERIKFKNIDEVPANNKQFKIEIEFSDINMFDEFAKIVKETELKLNEFKQLVNKLPDLANDGDCSEIIVPKEPVSRKVENIIENIKNKTLDANEIYEDGRTVLINFIDYPEVNEYERYLIIDELINQGCDVNLRDSSNGQTPLYYAAQENKLHIARLLIKNGAEVDAIQTNTLQTPLHAAAGSGSVELVKLLLNNGANINSKSKTGTTAIVKALMVYLMHLNNKGNPLSALLISNTNIDEIKATIDLLVERGADLDCIADPNSGVTIRELMEYLNL